MKSILLTIAARGGSKGVKNKNIKLLNGKPLIAITIEQAKKWGKASDLIVTTDSAEIAEIARTFGAEVPFLRPAELAGDTSAKVPALRHALLETEKLKKKKYDLIVDLDPTAPIRGPKDLDQMLALFLEKKPKTLFSVVHSHKSPYFNMIERDSQGFAVLSKRPQGAVVRRQDAPEVFSMNSSIYFYNRDYLADPSNHSAISDQSLFYVMEDTAGIDIDREIDFKFIEFLIKEGVVCI